MINVLTGKIAHIVKNVPILSGSRKLPLLNWPGIAMPNGPSDQIPRSMRRGNALGWLLKFGCLCNLYQTEITVIGTAKVRREIHILCSGRISCIAPSVIQYAPAPIKIYFI